jgi:hypothetical protein
MAAQPVDWVLVIYYGPSAHRATYGRLDNTKYTKDYIQLSRKVEFLDAIKRLFPVTADEDGIVPLTYCWPTGTAPGTLVFNSADRPHLKWETTLGAPTAWKMSLTPSETAAETIPGDPNHKDFDAAENELAMLATRGAGQPYLMAIKLHGEPTTLHLRAYLGGASEQFAWADLSLVPRPIQELAAKTSQNSALAWSTYASGGATPSASVKQTLVSLDSFDDPVVSVNELSAEAGRGLAEYLRRPAYGLFFDPSQNHNSWIEPAPISAKLAPSIKVFLEALDARHPLATQGDALAETAAVDPCEVEAFQIQITEMNYAVADATSTTKTRGSAQRAFANAVKSNYGHRCAITGIVTKDFLVASHIVPWSEDQSIRLDPSNGICLSLMLDRAFETGLLLVEDDLTIRIDWNKVGQDTILRRLLGPHDGQKLARPKSFAPRIEFLQRRRALVASSG